MTTARKTDLSKTALLKNLLTRIEEAARDLDNGEITTAEYIAERSYCQETYKSLEAKQF